MLSEEVVASGVLMLLGVRSIWGADATRGGLVGGGGSRSWGATWVVAVVAGGQSGSLGG